MLTFLHFTQVVFPSTQKAGGTAIARTRPKNWRSIRDAVFQNAYVKQVGFLCACAWLDLILSTDLNSSELDLFGIHFAPNQQSCLSMMKKATEKISVSVLSSKYVVFSHKISSTHFFSRNFFCQIVSSKESKSKFYSQIYYCIPKKQSLVSSFISFNNLHNVCVIEALYFYHCLFWIFTTVKNPSKFHTKKYVSMLR